MTPEEKQQLKEKAALAALTGLLANPAVIKGIWDDQGPNYSDIVIESTCYADSFVDQMEMEETETENHEQTS